MLAVKSAMDGLSRRRKDAGNVPAALLHPPKASAAASPPTASPGKARDGVRSTKRLEFRLPPTAAESSVHKGNDGQSRALARAASFSHRLENGREFMQSQEARRRTRPPLHGPKGRLHPPFHGSWPGEKFAPKHGKFLHQPA